MKMEARDDASYHFFLDFWIFFSSVCNVLWSVGWLYLAIDLLVYQCANVLNSDGINI